MEREPSDADRLFREFAASGDPSALGEVYDLLGAELLKVALHTARDAAEAEDVLQATFVAAIERADQFDRTQRVMPWLVGILANEARKVRAKSARTPDPERLERSRPPDPELEVERAELLAMLDTALERVPAAFRPVLTLRLRHGLSVPEIAAALERPSGTIRSQLARGTEILRRTLPAGLAGALVLASTPTRGLAAVRTAVVEHAALLHGTSTATVVIGGALAVKKWIAAVVVIVGALWVWNSTRVDWGERDEKPIDPVASLVSIERERDAEPALATDDRPEPSREAQPIASTPIAAAPEVMHVASLVVHARWPDGSPAAGEVALLMPPSGRSDDPVVQTTDERGDARVDGLESGVWFVRLLRGREGMVQLFAGRTAELTLQIQGGVTVDGRVVDARGEPVAAASVWLSERYRTDIGHTIARSDERGSFTLRCVGPDAWLGAHKRGFAPSSLRSVRGATGDHVALEIRLEQSARPLRGEVRDEGGNAIAGALVMLGDAPPPSARNTDGSFSPSTFPQRARTDADGRFEIESAPLGVQSIQSRAAGFAPMATTFDVIADGQSECALTLQREARIVGRVRSSDGRALAGAWIHTATIDRFGDTAAWSRMDGTFELTGVGTGNVTLVAQHEEHGRAQREFTLRPGTTTEWDVTLAAVPAITGRVLDSHGKPVAKVVVVAMHPDDREHRTRSAATDDDGQFRIDELDARGHFLWVQPLDWRGFPLLTVEDVWPDGVPLVLRLPDGAQNGSITAEIVASDGAPIVGAELQVWHNERKVWRSFASEGERGTVKIDGVPEGTVTLDVRHPDYPWKHLGDRHIAAGEKLELGKIALDPSGRLRVSIKGAEELETALTVALVGAENRESGVARIVAGELSSGPLSPGVHTLMISGDGVRQVRRKFTIEEGRDTEFALALERCPVRSVTFTWPYDVPAPKWISCSLLDAENKLVWGGNAECASTPVLAKVSAPPGNYVLMAGGEGGLTGQVEFVMSDARSNEPGVELNLARRR